MVFALACGRKHETETGGPEPGRNTAPVPTDPQDTPSKDAGTDAAAASKAAATPVRAIASSGESSATFGPDDDAYGAGSPCVVRSIGHTSVAFKVELSTGKKAAFKPASRRGPLRYKGEVAAYRLGVALGLPNVPRAFLRTFHLQSLIDATHEASGEQLLQKEVLASKEGVKGALIPWIDGLEFPPFEREPRMSEWKAWLSARGNLPPEQENIARQLSTLLAFDYVTGNWDRFSGGNIGFDKASDTVLFIDNDGAFFEVPPADGLARNERLVRSVDRFSRSFVSRLRELDRAALLTAIGKDAAGDPLLGAKATQGIWERRTRLLELIDAKCTNSSEEAVLRFP